MKKVLFFIAFCTISLEYLSAFSIENSFLPFANKNKTSITYQEIDDKNVLTGYTEQYKNLKKHIINTPLQMKYIVSDTNSNTVEKDNLQIGNMVVLTNGIITERFYVYKVDKDTGTNKVSKIYTLSE